MGFYHFADLDGKLKMAFKETMERWKMATAVLFIVLAVVLYFTISYHNEDLSRRVIGRELCFDACDEEYVQIVEVDGKNVKIEDPKLQKCNYGCAEKWNYFGGVW